MNRQQRRAIEKKKKKEEKKLKKSGVTQEQEIKPQVSLDQKVLQIIEQKFNNLTNEVTKAKTKNTLLENKLNLMIETFERLEILSWEDLRETEALFIENEKNKQIKIKELLAEDYTTREFLDVIEEDPKLPRYKRFDIDPVRDLNINPYEIAQIVRDDNPEKSNEELCVIGSLKYKLDKHHFGLK